MHIGDRSDRGWSGEGGGGGEGEGESGGSQGARACPAKEYPIAAARSHDPIANTSMIHPAKNTRRGDRHESTGGQTASVTVFLRDGRQR